MRVKVVVAVVLGVLVLSACAAWAQYGGYGAMGEKEQPYVRAKIGWFIPNESELDSDVAFGVDYMVPAQMAYLTIDRLHAEDTLVETTAWSVLVGLYRPIQQYRYPLYYMGGIGWSRQTLETPLGDRDDDNFAWEVGLGAKWGGKGFAEIKYRDGGEDGNTGPIIFIGTSF